MRTFQRLHAYMRASRGLFSGLFREQGQALVEVALMTPIFLLVLLGAVECARLEYAEIEITNAARAGAEYGAQNSGTAANYNIMESTALADASDLSTLTATGSSFCNCSTGGTVSCTSPGTCTRVLQYVEVQTQAVITPLFTVPGLPGTLTLNGQAIMRVEQ